MTALPIRFLLLAALTASFSSVHVAAAGEAVAVTGPIQAPSCPRQDDEVWLISTRHLCFQCGTDPTSYELDVRRHDANAGWVDSSMQEFLAQPPLHTVVYVHGNRIEWSESFHHGWDVYSSLATCCPTPDRFRFVIWSWESSQVRGPLRDIRYKAGVADNETQLFGGFLAQLPMNAPLSLVGYSYGARVIGGGLDWYATQRTILPTVESPHAGTFPIRVALLAAAMDHDSLCPGACFGSALTTVNDLLILYNSCDPALQRYHLVDKCSRGVALGYVGLPEQCAVSFGTSVEQIDVCCQVGRTHDEERYFCLDYVREQICRVLFAP